MKRNKILKIIAWLAGLGFLLSLVLFIWLPRYLVQQATQAPPEETFVTHAVNAQQALPQVQAISPAQAMQMQNQAQRVQSEGRREALALEPIAEPGTTQIENNDFAENSSSAESPGSTNNEAPRTRSNRLLQSRDRSGRNSGSSSQQGSLDQSERHRPSQRAQDSSLAQLQISEQQISSLIYSGLVGGSAPQYRQAIQGVSTRISDGKARVTVALLPRYLPPNMLNSLPGVNRDTPTVYVGGQARLSVSNGQLVPHIEGIRIGNFSLPMPFIQQGAASGFQAYARQMLVTADGRQLYAESVQLDSGQITVTGHTR